MNPMRRSFLRLLGAVGAVTAAPGLALADRILVMCEGRIMGELAASEATEQRLGLLMAGIGRAA